MHTKVNKPIAITEANYSLLLVNVNYVSIRIQLYLLG
jgi:hypothetical protein